MTTNSSYCNHNDVHIMSLYCNLIFVKAALLLALMNVVVGKLHHALYCYLKKKKLSHFKSWCLYRRSSRPGAWPILHSDRCLRAELPHVQPQMRIRGELFVKVSCEVFEPWVVLQLKQNNTAVRMIQSQSNDFKVVVAMLCRFATLRGGKMSQVLPVAGPAGADWRKCNHSLPKEKKPVW